VFFYILGENTEYERFLKSATEELRCRAITVPSKPGMVHGDCSCHFDAGPFEFVSFIKHAKYVITDSFHGVVFSLIYNKPFAVLRRTSGANNDNKMFSRLDSLLTLCKIKPPIVNNESIFLKDMLSIDFTNANDVLEGERRKSLQYLSDSIKKALER
jgi:hypothetical protein